MRKKKLMVGAAVAAVVAAGVGLTAPAAMAAETGSLAAGAPAAAVAPAAAAQGYSVVGPVQYGNLLVMVVTPPFATFEECTSQLATLPSLLGYTGYSAGCTQPFLPSEMVIFIA